MSASTRERPDRCVTRSDALGQQRTHAPQHDRTVKQVTDLPIGRAIVRNDPVRVTRWQSTSQDGSLLPRSALPPLGSSPRRHSRPNVCSVSACARAEPSRPQRPLAGCDPESRAQLPARRARDQAGNLHHRRHDARMAKRGSARFSRPKCAGFCTPLEFLDDSVSAAIAVAGR
jgi:hypothetical protein